MEVESRHGEKRGLQAPPAFAGELSKKVREVRVGEQKYFVADEDLDVWFEHVTLDDRFLEEDLPDFNAEHDVEPLVEWGTEEEGPPILSVDEMEVVEAQSRKTEVERLRKMNVIVPVDTQPPGDKTLKTRYIYDWRYRGRWVRRARLVCKELRVWNPFRQATFAPATSPSMLRLLPHLFVSTPNWTLRSFDVKDAYLTVPQKEELYVRLDHECFRVLKCLPGQQDAAAQWNVQISADLSACQLEPNAACPVVYAGENCGVTLHVDDGLIGGYEEKVEKVVTALVIEICRLALGP